MTYTKEQFLKAAELGEVSMIDAKHIVSLLDEVELPQQNDVREDGVEKHPLEILRNKIKNEIGKPMMSSSYYGGYKQALIDVEGMIMDMLVIPSVPQNNDVREDNVEKLNELKISDGTIPLNSFIFNLKNEPIIIIDEKGFKYKGELIEDSGDVYVLFKEFLQNSQLPQQKENTYTEEDIDRLLSLYSDDAPASYIKRDYKKYLQTIKQTDNENNAKKPDTRLR